MSKNKIGFNNFKAFGPKMQYFSKKPITLIYGPNSIGKSSLIRALLFKEYLKTSRTEISEFKDKPLDGYFWKFKKEAKDISTVNFGDKYNIGNFESIIHKHNLDENINFDFTYDEKEVFLEMISFNIYLYVYFVGILKITDISKYLTFIKNKMELKYVYKDNSSKSEDKLLNDSFLETENRILNTLGIHKSDLEEKSNVNTLFKFLDFINQQFDINKIRIKSTVDKNLKQEHHFYVDEILLFKCSDRSNTFKIFDLELYTNNSVFEKVFFKPKNIKVNNQYNFSGIEVYEFDYRHLKIPLLSIESNYDNYLKSFIKVLLRRVFITNTSFKNYYIGPIRNIPSREDLYGKKNFFKRQRRKQSLIKKNLEQCFYKISKIGFIYYPLSFFCSIKKFFYTFNNSLYKRGGINFIKYIKPNTYNNFFLWHSLLENKEVIKKVNNWLSHNGKHNSSYSLKLDNDNIYKNYYKLSFYDSTAEANVHPQDMGVGISQSLPIIVASNLFNFTDIYIEQPELHLHPKLQMELADEFIRSYKENENTFILETHSEHLLLRIMKRMRWAEEDKEDRDKGLDITPDDICLLYVDSNGKTTYLNELELDTDGSLLDPWPNGFFEEGHKERFD